MGGSFGHHLGDRFVVRQLVRSDLMGYFRFRLVLELVLGLVLEFSIAESDVGQ